MAQTFGVWTFTLRAQWRELIATTDQTREKKKGVCNEWVVRTKACAFSGLGDTTLVVLRKGRNAVCPRMRAMREDALCVAERCKACAQNSGEPPAIVILSVRKCAGVLRKPEQYGHAVLGKVRTSAGKYCAEKHFWGEKTA